MKEERLYQSVARKIAKLIDDGSYPVGSRLPGERDLARRFNVSRVTVREAEIALQSIGRLKIRTGSGVYVAGETKMKTTSVLQGVSAFELTQARLLFESEAAALAAPVISDETLADLDRLAEKMKSNLSDETESANREFHLTIASASKNKAVSYVIESLLKIRAEVDPVRELYDSVCSSNASTRGHDHAEILDALRPRNPAIAREAVREHFGRLMETMIDTTETQALDEFHRKSSESRQRLLRNM